MPTNNFLESASTAAFVEEVEELNYDIVFNLTAIAAQFEPQDLYVTLPAVTLGTIHVLLN